ncbi:AAA ATPase [Trebouxia sp. C0010 RCD-2024]
MFQALGTPAGGSCRPHLLDQVRRQLEQSLSLTPGTSKIILVTGPRDSVRNHQADLAQLQSVVTQQPRRYSTLDTYVVVIDDMRVVNSSKSHRQLRELFQLTRLPHSRLILVCIGQEVAFSRVDIQDAVHVEFPVYSNHEIHKEMTERMRKWPEVICQDALAYLAQSEGAHMGSMKQAVGLCNTVLHKSTAGRLQNQNGGAGNINAPLSIVEAQRASLGKQDAATSFNKVTLTVMEQFILKRTPEPTPAETRAQWQIDYDEKHKAIREHKATMVSWRASASFSSDKELQRQGKEQRQILHELEAEHLTLPTQWTGFQLDRLPSEDATHQKSVHRFDWYPECDYVTATKQMKLLPTVNGQKAVGDPDAKPHEACGSSCNLVHLEKMCCTVAEHAVFIRKFGGQDFIAAWKLLIRKHILKATGVRQGRPTRLQLQVREWHLRAAFEKDSLANTLVKHVQI